MQAVVKLEMLLEAEGLLIEDKPAPASSSSLLVVGMARDASFCRVAVSGRKPRPDGRGFLLR